MSFWFLAPTFDDILVGGGGSEAGIVVLLATMRDRHFKYPVSPVQPENGEIRWRLVDFVETHRRPNRNGDVR